MSPGSETSPFPPSSTLGDVARQLTLISAAAFAVLGVILFVAPAWAATRFAWTVTPFMTMTIGAWCLGNAVVATHAARVWRWATVHPLFVYLWSFSLLEALVLVRFHAKIVFGAALTWPYLATLALALVAAVAGVADVLRLRPSLRGEDSQAGPVLRVLWAIFAALVGFIGLAAFVKAHATNLKVFPEPMTPFTLRAFGGFYLSLALGAAAVAMTRTLRPAIAYTSAPSTFTGLITLACLVYLHVFDLSAHHLQWIYLGAYLGALVLGLSVFAWARNKERSDARIGST
ncbi:MAG: hypothetical protein M3P11_04500 [Actinomycetota bacterium]|nr:hypothetical protein [Actinomycetota bacterium]